MRESIKGFSSNEHLGYPSRAVINDRYMKLSRLTPIVGGFRSSQMLGISLLTGITAYQLIVLAVWLKLDLRPPRHDESMLLMISLHSFEHLRSGDILGALRIFEISNTKTGLVSFLAALSYFLVGVEYDIATFLINGLAIIGIAIAMGVMGHRLFGDVLVGTAAFSLFLTCHLVAAWSHFFILDLPLTAFVSLTVAAMLEIHANRFRPTPWVAVLAIALALGIPTKHLYIGFVAAPLAFLFLHYILRNPEPFRARLRNASLVAGVSVFAILIGLGYHVLNWPVVQEMLLRSKDAALTGGAGAPPSAASVLNQVDDALFYGFGVYVLAAGTLVLVFRGRFALMFLLTWIVGSAAVVFQAASYPMNYYLMPAFPAASLLAFAWLGQGVISKWMYWPTRAALITLVFIGIAALTYVHLGTANPLLVIARAPTIMTAGASVEANPFVPFDSTKQIAFGRLPGVRKVYNRPELGDRTMQYTLYDGNEQILPYPFDWQMDRFVQTMKSSLGDRSSLSQPLAVAIMSEAEYFSSNLLDYEMRRQGIRNMLVNKRNTPLWSRKFDEDLGFVITKTGPVYKEVTPGDEQRFAESALANDGEMLKAEGFRPAVILPLPDGSVGTLWKHNGRVGRM